MIATAAQNSYDSKNASSSKGMSLGVTYDPFVGGVGFYGNISASKSKGKSEGVTHQGALIDSGNKVSITTKVVTCDRAPTSLDNRCLLAVWRAGIEVQLQLEM